jgi:hypothetical protein
LRLGAGIAITEAKNGWIFANPAIFKNANEIRGNQW